MTCRDLLHCSSSPSITAATVAARLLVTSVCFIAAAAANRTTAGAESGNTWAVLIGVEKYHRAPPLEHTVNDVNQLAATLQERAGVDPQQIVTFVDGAEDAARQPLQQTLLDELPKWLANAGPDDRLIVYFSGHGFHDQQGKLHLAPIDCDPAKAADTGLPVEWLRTQIAGCRAGFKLLVLDACHAGTEKGDAAESVTAKELGEPFRDLKDVVTLASSTGDEKSLLWPAKKQSLFSFWLNQGLKGHADEDGDAAVDIDELNKYIHRNVTRTARVRFGREQTPVRIVRSGAPGVPVVVQVRPLSLRQVLTDMAEQLATAMQERQLDKVGVLEFTTDTRVGEALGGNFGLLGRYCATELEQRLIGNSADQFNVIDNRRLLSALKSQQFTVEDLGSSSALQALADRAGGLRAIALGTLRSRNGRVVTLQCRLLQTDDDSLAGFAAGTAQLNESEWAMLGFSAQIPISATVPPLPISDAGADAPIADETTQIVAAGDAEASKPHPLMDPKFPYRLKIVVGGKERKAVFHGNDCYVPLEQGEQYEIWVENLSGDMALLRLLVDGLNTLPEREKTRAVETFLVAHRVNLDEARHWVLDPQRSRVFAVRGFFTKLGQDGTYRAFKVVDANQSLAARQQFTDQVGLITAAFYRPPSGGRGIGTDFGTEGRDAVGERAVAIGSLIAVLHIRYAEPQVIQKLPRQ